MPVRTKTRHTLCIASTFYGLPCNPCKIAILSLQIALLLFGMHLVQQPRQVTHSSVSRRRLVFGSLSLSLFSSFARCTHHNFGRRGGGEEDGERGKNAGRDCKYTVSQPETQSQPDTIQTILTTTDFIIESDPSDVVHACPTQVVFYLLVAAACFVVCEFVGCCCLLPCLPASPLLLLQKIL
jgi:hypothetical protein